MGGELNEVYIKHNGRKYEFVYLSSDMSAERELNEGDVVEYSQDRQDFLKHFSKFKSKLLLIDYGYFKPINVSTLQVVKDHKKIDLLSNIGVGDITALVDFGYLAKYAHSLGGEIFLSTQADFLSANHIVERASAIYNATKNKDIIEYDLKRLISSQEMGELFKVMEVNFD